MQLYLNHIGETIIELTAETQNGGLTSDVCNLDGIADPELIETLREIVEALTDHNEKRNKYLQTKNK